MLCYVNQNVFIYYGCLGRKNMGFSFWQLLFFSYNRLEETPVLSKTREHLETATKRIMSLKSVTVFSLYILLFFIFFTCNFSIFFLFICQHCNYIIILVVCIYPRHLYVRSGLFLPDLSETWLWSCVPLPLRLVSNITLQFFFFL